VRRVGRLTLAGIAVALLWNFWVLGLLDAHSDASSSWISDLAARSQGGGWRFELLEVASGIALTAFALLLLLRLGRRAPMLRWGLLALVLAGALTAIGGAAPLNCAEALDPRCTVNYDLLDIVHTSANVIEVIVTAAAFVLLGTGLRGVWPRRTAGHITIAIGAIWLLLSVVTAFSYLSGDVDSVKGLFQRAVELLFGGWLVLLGIWTEASSGNADERDAMRA
jgi:Protein of unknown function (DUF998)